MISRFITQVLAVFSILFLLACGGGGGNGDDNEPVPDTIAPVITLIGDNPMFVNQGSTFTDPGATVSDNVDSGLTASVSGSVDTSVIGEYTLTYNASDAAGNAANSVTRTVNVLGPQTGKFTGTIISGLSYRTTEHSGVSNSSGEFTYNYGETIVFFISDTVIGEEVAAKSEMNIMDLVPNAQIYTTRSEVDRLLRQNVNNSEERRAFNQLSNILSFLHTLDDDRNPANGINLATGLEDLFDGVAIDFSIDYTEFHLNSILKQTTHRASNMEFISSANILKPGFSLDYFYDSQNISHNLAVTGTYNRDKGADGTINFENTNSYDSIGNLVKVRTYDDNPEVTDETKTITYDQNGNILKYSFDNNSDGIEDNYERLEYDDNGNLLFVYFTWFQGGDEVVSESRVYDELGNLIKHNDENGNISEYTYDSNGNRLTYSLDLDGDETFERKTQYTYDDNGNLLTEAYDGNFDGVFDSLTTYTYDDVGNQLTIAIDSSADGTINSFTNKTFDQNGNILTTSHDNDFDGVVDQVFASTYNSDGYLLTKSHQTPEDENPIFEYVYEYDSRNNLVYWEWDIETDGVLDLSATEVYDAENNKISSDLDFGGNGEVDNARVYTYDTFGNRLTLLEDIGGNGTINESRVYLPVNVNWRAVLSTF